MDNLELIKEIEKDYEIYRKNGGHLGFMTFAHQWIKRHREIVKEFKDKLGV